MHPELWTHTEVLHLQAASFDQGTEDRQAGFRVGSVHGLELPSQVRNDDVAGQGLVEDDADRCGREPRHVARGGEDPVMRGEMQARVQPAEGGAPRNEVHDDLDTQRHEWFRHIRDDQNLNEIKKGGGPAHPPLNQLPPVYRAARRFITSSSSSLFWWPAGGGSTLPR